MVTNLALPFADWYVTRTIWQFGVAASSAAGVYDRIMPFGFSLVFALTTSVGPIAGQNLGAGLYGRVRLTFLHAVLVAGIYSLGVWMIVSASAPALATLFGLSGAAGEFFKFLCRYATLAWVFVALLLVANTMFNTLGRAHVSTLFNWGPRDARDDAFRLARSTLGRRRVRHDGHRRCGDGVRVDWRWPWRPATSVASAARCRNARADTILHVT